MTRLTQSPGEQDQPDRTEGRVVTELANQAIPAGRDGGQRAVTHSRRPLRQQDLAAAHALAEPGRALNRRMLWAFAGCVGGANFVGAIVAFVFQTFVMPTPIPGRSVNWVNVAVFVPYLLVAMAVGALLTNVAWRPVQRWLVADRAPDEPELRLTLRQPLRQAGFAASQWVIAAFVFAGLNASDSLALAAEVGTMVLLGGLVTCSLCYLLVERTMRPVTARALAAGPPRRPTVPGVATRIGLAWGLASGVILLVSALMALLVLLGIPATTERLAVTVLFLSLGGLGIGMAAIRIAARSVADPVESVRSSLAEVESGNLEAETPVYDGSEVGMLQAGFNRMVAGLRERERLRDLFGRHVGEDVARLALDRGLELGGEVREVAVLFVDVIGSTAYAAKEDPRRVVETLNAFFGIVVETVSLHGGWVNKFEGDAALCVFGAPAPHPDAAGSALAAGRALQERLARELPDVQTGIGLSAGPAVAGNVGAAERFEYTVIGDPVNEAARLTELAKTAPGRLLASEAIVARAGPAERARWQVGDGVTLRGRSAPTRLATPVSAPPAGRA